MNRKTCLVLGASRGYGSSIFNFLRSNKHIVYAMQRSPGPGWAIPTEAEAAQKYWLRTDLKSPAQIVGAVTQFVEEGVIFDFVFLVGTMKESVSKEAANQFHFEHHFMVNVLSPLLLLKYLIAHGRVHDNSTAVFFLDERKVKEDFMPYFFSKHLLESAVQSFKKPYLGSMRTLFISPKDSDTPGFDDELTETISSLVKGNISPNIKIINFK